jgi:hypothetical protein
MDAQQQRRIDIAEISLLMDPESKSKYVWLLTTVAQKDDKVYELMLEWRNSTTVGRQFTDTYIAQEMQDLVLSGAKERIRSKI